MTNQLIFATGNAHKVAETAKILAGIMPVVSMRDYGILEDIPETKPTLEGCALQKARYLANGYHINCFSEDTGLEVAALDGAPGVRTARYAGEPRSTDNNIALLLQKLKGVTNRTAQFRTIIALILDGEEHLFEGIVKGKIAHQKEGVGGFGYDPVFIPEGYDQTFANLPSEVKNSISHRKRALDKMVDFLKNRFQ